jgi:hypothetical protein
MFLRGVADLKVWWSWHEEHVEAIRHYLSYAVIAAYQDLYECDVAGDDDSVQLHLLIRLLMSGRLTK